VQIPRKAPVGLKREDRRLTTILAADVVGYSRLMAADETGTLAQLRTHRKELIEPKTAEHHGRVVKLMGDGTLMEFGSVVNAVNFAVDVQKAMAERNVDVPDERQITYRIGINIGDIIVEDDDIYGDGVNVAARLEQLAEPGGICIAGNVFDQVKNKIDICFQDMGEQDLKNVPEPRRAYRIVMGEKDVGPAVVDRSEPLPLPDTPTIAVLPFDNMSGDPGQAYFADGIAEDITTELSRFGSLFVVSRNSAFKYRGDNLDLAQISRELGAHYFLKGSVRREGDRVRITAQLIDAESGNHIWAERYDRQLEDIFAIQDEITEIVASTVAGRVQAIGMDRAKRKRSENLEAYDYLLKGLDLHKGGFIDTETVERSVAMFDKAIELDKGFARAHAWRACSGSRLWGDDFSDEQLDECLEITKTALSLDEGESETHRIMGSIYLWKRDFARAEKHIRRSIALNPNDAHVTVKAGTYFSFAGQPEEALALVRRAMRLDPHHPQWYWTEMGLAYHTAGDYPSAIEALLHNSTPSFLDLALLAASFAEEGSIAEARAYAKQLSETKPNATLSYFRGRLPYRRQEDLDRLIAGLQKAGVPEE
jgi:adenylate cyclase